MKTLRLIIIGFLFALSAYGQGLSNPNWPNRDRETAESSQINSSQVSNDPSSYTELGGLPIQDGISILLVMSLGYFIVKSYKRWKYFER